METFKKIVTLQRNAREFATFWNRFDRQSAEFGRDVRFSIFKVQTFFTSRSLVYGGSSSDTSGGFDLEIAEEYMVRAMNAMREELFAKAAELLRSDAAALRAEARNELSEMTQKLDALEQVDQPEQPDQPDQPDEGDQGDRGNQVDRADQAGK